MTNGITLHIRPKDVEQDQYEIVADLDDGDHFGPMRVTIPRQQLLIAEQNLQFYGLTLFNALCQGEILEAYNRAVERARGSTFLQVRLWVDELAPELHVLPWERLASLHNNQFTPLAANSGTPFSRYTGLKDPHPAPIDQRPLRLLLAIAHPGNLPTAFAPIDVAAEVEMLLTALGDVPKSQLAVTLLAGRTALAKPLCKRVQAAGWQLLEQPTSLNNVARALPGHHILHLIAHGSFSMRQEEGSTECKEEATLHLEDENSQWAKVKDVDMTAKVSGLDSKPQLIFLSACQSATRSETAPFVGLAPRLVRAGVPAVVAMQDRVPMTVARQLTGDFYRALLAHGSVDQALNQARNLLFASENTDWAIPVLFLRSKGSRLFAPPQAEDEESALSLTDPERAYLNVLQERCNRLSLAEDIRGQGGQGQRKEDPAQLVNVYVDLQVQQKPTLEQVLDRLHVHAADRPALVARLQKQPGRGGRRSQEPIEEAEMGEAQLFALPQDEDDFKKHPLQPYAQDREALTQALQPLSALEALAAQPRLVLLGDPGSGKSTFVNHLSYDLANRLVQSRTANHDGQEPGAEPPFFPLHLVLRQWSGRLTPQSRAGRELLYAALSDATGLDRATILLRLNRPDTLLLLDGLDEAPAADPEDDGAFDRRGLVVESIQDLLTAHKECRALVTSRIKPYSEAYHLAGLPDVPLAPLDSPRITRFIHRWYAESARREPERTAKAEGDREKLLAGLERRRDLAQMAGTPLLLTMLAAVNAWAGLPESRAELYDRCVEQLLWEWERRKREEREEGGLISLHDLLQEAGLKRTDVEWVLWELTYAAHARSGADNAELPIASLRTALAGIHPKANTPSAWAWGQRVISLISERSGLLLLTDLAGFTFPHRSFQEYLAARWLLELPDRNVRAAQLAQTDTWQEVVLLAAGYLAYKDRRGDVQALVSEMVGGRFATPEEWRRLLTAGQAWLEFNPRRAVGNTGDALRERVPRLLTALMQDAAAPPRTRLDAGLLAADLDVLPPDLDEFVSIADRGKLGYDFQMARYPVTNAQYRRFVAATGHRDSWMWDEHNWSYPTQPVTGISWEDAVAYCEWLTGELQGQQTIGQDEMVRLPTEAEWLWVTAGVEGRTYAWGEEFHVSRANSKESDLDQPTPVHMYPDGATREGVWDLCGNVWEWSNEDHEREQGAKALRGGAYYEDAEGVQASARVRDDRWDQFYDHGFRCVVVPISRR